MGWKTKHNDGGNDMRVVGGVYHHALRRITLGPGDALFLLKRLIHAVTTACDTVMVSIEIV